MHKEEKMHKALLFFNIVLLLYLASCQTATFTQPASTATSQPANTTVPTAAEKTDIPDIVTITDLSVTPLENGKVGINACTSGKGGVGITLRVSYNSSPKADESGEWRIIKELGVPCFNQIDRPVWETNDLPKGQYLIKVQARYDDLDWENTPEKTVVYEVK